MSRLFNLLGSLHIEEAGRVAVVMKSPKTCALLAYLIITNRVESREKIADLLWESESTSQSLTRLRVLLGRARKTVPELVVTRRTVAFAAVEGTTIDYQILLAGLQSTDPNTIDKTLQLYDDELMRGFYLPDAPRFNEWLLLERERLRYEVQKAYQQLCVAYADEEAWEMGAAAAQRWLALEPLNEMALRQLMQNLALSGQVSAALQQYERSREYLWQELAVDPEETTQTLARQFTDLQAEQLGEQSWAEVAETAILWPDAETLPPPGALPTQAYLPYLRNHDFTGRHESLSFLAEHLQVHPFNADALPQIVAITGMGGIGKTQLAVEYCYRYGRYYPGGVFWLNFAQAGNVAAEVARIGGERGMGLYQEADRLTLADKTGRVQKAWQEPIPRLLIFDNCEEEALLAAWLPKTGGCRVLLTSRRGDWSPELRLAQRTLPILDLPESIVFLRRLVPELTETEAAEIADEVGHLPLALHLSGSFLRCYRQVVPARYLAQVRDQGLLSHPALRGRGTRHSPTGHELNVARTFALSLKQLHPAGEIDDMAQRLLVRIACLAPGELVPRPLLQATVLNSVTRQDDLLAVLLVEDGLARLIALGLVEERGRDSVLMHRLLVAFIKSGVAGVDEGQTAVEKAIVQALEAVWNPTTSYLGDLPVAAPHVKTVTDAALARESAQCGRLASLWGRHLMDVGYLQQAQPYLERALNIQETTAAKEAEIAETVQNLGTLMWRVHGPDSAWAYYERAMNIHKRIFGPNHMKTAHSLNNLGILHSRSGEFDEAQSYYEQALSIYEQEPEANQVAIARALYNLGIMHNRMGDYKQAQVYHERALVIREKSLAADHPDFVSDLLNLGGLANNLGDYEKALSYKKRAHRIRQKALKSDSLLLASSLNSMGATSVYLGAYDEAISYYQQAWAIWEKALPPDDPLIGLIMSNLGHYYLHTGDFEQAKNHLEKGLAIQEAVRPDHELTGITLSFLGDLHLRLGQPEEARPYLQRALSIREQMNSLHHVYVAHILIGFGEYYQAVGNDTEAKLFYRRALATLKDLGVLATHPDLQRVQNHLNKLES